MSNSGYDNSIQHHSTIKRLLGISDQDAWRVYYWIADNYPLTVDNDTIDIDIIRRAYAYLYGK